MRLNAGIVFLAVGFAPGCNPSVMFGVAGIPGSGVAKEEARAVDAFHAIDAGSALQVTVLVTPGAKPTGKINGDDNLVPLIESVVRDGTLILRLKDNSSISPKLPLLAEVTAGELDGVEASGAASVKVKGGTKVNRFTATTSGAADVAVEKVESSQAVANASGASHIVLAGSAASLKVDASGASQVKAEALVVEEAEVSISGASGVALHANKSVEGDVAGASRLDIHGSPARKDFSITGASQVVDNN